MIAKIVETLKRRRASGQRIFSVLFAQAAWARVRRGVGWDSPAERFRHLIELQAVELSPPPTPVDVSSLRLEWILPQFDAGSGGHATIFLIADELERRGHRNRFWFLTGDRYGDAAEVRRGMQRLFGRSREVEILDSAKVGQVVGDVCIATAWPTVYYAMAVKAVRKRCYFILDFEPAFYPAGSEALLAEQTYRLPLEPIPSSRWLAATLKPYYGCELQWFPLAVDHANYSPGHSDRTSDTVVFYLRETTPRRCAELGLLALEILARRRPQLVVHCIGQPAVTRRLPFRAVQHGMMTPAQLAELYRRAKVGFVMSSTNHSLVSIEMMACGLPVVELDAAPARMDFHEAVIRASVNPRLMAEAVWQLLSDEAGWRRQQAAGWDHVRGLDWAASAAVVEKRLQAGLERANP